MTRVPGRRASVAIALALVFVGRPWLADRCAASCEVAQKTQIVTASPTCHHTGSATVRIGRLPTRCGHDHATALTGEVMTSRLSTTGPAAEGDKSVVVPTALNPSATSTCHAALDEGPPPGSRAISPLLALRI
jgi:hypothetical protein